MSGIKARKWLNKKPFQGLPKRDDFEIVEEELPAMKDGEFIVEAQFLTVDPYLRITALGIVVPGKLMPGSQVAKVIQSKSKDYSVGDVVLGEFGWSSHSISDGSKVFKLDSSSPIPHSTALGVLGMPGATAYFGLRDICQPTKEGQTFLVNAAAGAVGSIIGQLAKLKGMKVIGFAGSDEKIEYLKSLGFDVAYNYKTIPSLEAAIKESCPNGVDVFFDNVGGKFLETVIPQMSPTGRVAICGSISQYNNESETKSNFNILGYIQMKQLKVQAFLGWNFMDEWPAAFKEMGQMIQDGKLKYRETVFEGFDSMCDAFVSLFSSNNIGKVVVKV